VWPDTVYVAVEPREPFVRLQLECQAAFPDFPIYGEPPGFANEPHVTVAEGLARADPATLADPAWTALPRPALASALEVVTVDDGRWRLVWRIPLGRSAEGAAARMRP
jgi:cell division septal protein FtsQ